MCGIVGTIGKQHPAQEVLVDGLRRLEYRGYDSAGVADLDDPGGRGGLHRGAPRHGQADRTSRSVLREDPLSRATSASATPAGPPTASRPSATPIPTAPAAWPSCTTASSRTTASSATSSRRRAARWSRRPTPNSSRIIIDREHRGRRRATCSGGPQRLCPQLVGSYALGAICDGRPEPHRRGQERRQPDDPGLGEGETFLASDIPAILPYTRQMIFLERRRVRRALSEDGVQVIDDAEGAPDRARAEGRSSGIRSPRRRAATTASCRRRSSSSRARSPTRSARASTRSRRSRSTSTASSSTGGSGSTKTARIALVACGTAYYACMVGKYMIEQLAGIPCEVDLASEFRYRQPILDPQRARRARLPVRRDRRHPRGAARRRVRAGRARHLDLQHARVVDRARERRRPLHARRPRDRRGVDEVLHRPGGRPLPAGAEARHLARQQVGARRSSPAAHVQDAACACRVSSRRRSSSTIRSSEVAHKYFQASRLPLPGPGHHVPDRARGRAEAQGDLVHPRRGLRRRRDEARPDRADRREHARRGDRESAARSTRRWSRTSSRCARATAR